MCVRVLCVQTDAAKREARMYNEAHKRDQSDCTFKPKITSQAKALQRRGMGARDDGSHQDPLHVRAAPMKKTRLGSCSAHS